MTPLNLDVVNFQFASHFEIIQRYDTREERQ
jgi:hypothetical protein